MNTILSDRGRQLERARGRKEGYAMGVATITCELLAEMKSGSLHDLNERMLKLLRDARDSIDE